MFTLDFATWVWHTRYKRIVLMYISTCKNAMHKCMFLTYYQHQYMVFGPLP